MIKNILFDLDDTILDFHASEHEALKKTLESAGITPGQEVLDRYSEINQWHWKQLELGNLTRAEVLLNRFKQLLSEYGMDVPAELIRERYEVNLSHGYHILPGSVEMLKKLQGKYRLFLVSNGTATVQYSRLKGAGIGHYFEAVFISEELGYEKPDARFFEAALSMVWDIKKEETIIVGDSLTSDMQGGNNAGITAVWFNPRGKENNSPARPDYEIRDWKGLYKLLEGL